MRIITRTTEIIREKIRIRRRSLDGNGIKTHGAKGSGGFRLDHVYIELTSPGFFGDSVYNADRTDADDGLPW